MNQGLVLVAAWAQLGVLAGLLAFFLRRPGSR